MNKNNDEDFRIKLPLQVSQLSDGTLVLVGPKNKYYDYDETVQIIKKFAIQLDKTNSKQFKKTIREADMDYQFSILFEELGRTQYLYYPVESMGIKKKKYKGNKSNRVWTFVCGCCGNKISVQSGDVYYIITLGTRGVLGFSMFDKEYIEGMSETERACSIDCIRVIAKEIAINTINRTYIKCFNLEKISDDIDKYLETL